MRLGSFKKPCIMVPFNERGRIMEPLKSKSNETLITDLKQMVTEERRLLTEILHHLKEVEDRHLYLERGYPSLFAFVTEELGYSEAAAQRRIQAMRLMRDVPQVEDKMKRGALSLSVASQVQSFLRLESKKRDLSTTEKLNFVTQLEGTSARKCEKQLAEIAPEIKKSREKIKAIGNKTTLIQFVADQKLMEEIEKLKELLAHRNVGGRFDGLFKILVQMGLEKWDPEQRIARRKKKATNQNKQTLSTSEVKNRHIPAVVRDEVWQRDEGRCQYQDPVTGRVCRSRHGLQFDHTKPYARGGSHDSSNLRLLCRQHNLMVARKVFGKRWIDLKVMKPDLRSSRNGYLIKKQFLIDSFGAGMISRWRRCPSIPNNLKPFSIPKDLCSF